MGLDCGDRAAHRPHRCYERAGSGAVGGDPERELPGCRPSSRHSCEAYEPPPAIVEEARRLVAAAGMDVGGVEYLVNERDGQHYFYDVNALLDFVADAPNVIGFNPYANLVDLILERAELSVSRVSAA